MNTEQKNFLIELINTPAPSGFEEPVQELWKKEVSKFCSSIKKDVHGNLVAVLNPGKEKSLMVAGHADEIGLIVNYINNEGFIFVRPIGGVDPTILGSHRARILTKKGVVHAAIGRTSLHLLTAKERDKKQELQNNTAMARCWDNRIGVYIAAEVLRKLVKVKNLNKTIYIVSSVQEETGVWGARNAPYEYKPTAAIAVDVFPCSDQPEITKERFGESKVGYGPI